VAGRALPAPRRDAPMWRRCCLLRAPEFFSPFPSRQHAAVVRAGPTADGRRSRPRPVVVGSWVLLIGLFPMRRPSRLGPACSSFTWLVRALHCIDLSPAREVVDNRVEFGGGLAAAIERPLTRKNSAVLDLERNTGSCIWLGLPVLVRVPHGFGARRDVVGWSKPLPRFTGRHVWRAPSLSLSRLAHFLPAVLTTCGPLPVEP